MANYNDFKCMKCLDSGYLINLSYIRIEQHSGFCECEIGTKIEQEILKQNSNNNSNKIIEI